MNVVVAALRTEKAGETEQTQLAEIETVFTLFGSRRGRYSVLSTYLKRGSEQEQAYSSGSKWFESHSIGSLAITSNLAFVATGEVPVAPKL